VAICVPLLKVYSESTEAPAGIAGPLVPSA
jgi:hypothetical protein